MEIPSAYVDLAILRGPFPCGNICFALPVFFPTALPLSSRALMDYHLERGGIPLHDAVWVNCKEAATTENQGTSA